MSMKDAAFWDMKLFRHFSLSPLSSSGQSSWLQIQMPGFDSRRYQIFREEMGLERGPLILVSTIEELSERKSRDSRSREQRIRPLGSAAVTTRHYLCPQKLALTPPTSGGRLFCIVRSRTKAT
jgi:hypothetical protein